MSINTLNTKFKLRRDTLENWTTNNPTIAAGEPILVFDGNDTKIKIGKEPNGSTFNDTEYYGGDWDSLLNKPFYDEPISGESYEIDLTQPQVGQMTFDEDAGVVGHFYQISEQYYDIDTLKTFTCDYEMIDDSGAPMTQEQDVPLTTLAIEENAMPGITAIMIGDFPFFLAIIEEIKIGADTYAPGLYGVHGEVPSYCTWTGLKLTAPDRIVTHKIDNKYVDTSMDTLTGTTQLPNVNLSVPENGSEYDFYLQVGDYYGFEIYSLGIQMASEDFSNLGAQTTEWDITISQSDDNDIILSDQMLYYDGNCSILFNQNNLPCFTILNIGDNQDISQYLDGIYISSKNPYYIQNSGLYLIQGIYHNITNLQGLNYTDSQKKVKSISYTLNGGSLTSLFTNSNDPIDDYSYSGAPNTTKMYYVGDTIINREDIDSYTILVDDNESLSNELFHNETNRNFSDTWEYKGANIDFYNLTEGWYVLVAHEDNLTSSSREDAQTFTVPKAGTYLSQRKIYKPDTEHQPTLDKQSSVISIARLNKKEIQPLNSDYIKLPWENITNAPFGEVSYSPYYVQGPSNYEELMSAETTYMSQVEIYTVKIGDYIDPQKLSGDAEITLSQLDSYTGENNSFEIYESFSLNSGQFHYINNNSIRWESQQGINLLFVSASMNVFGGTLNRGIYSMLFTDDCSKEDEFGNTIQGTTYFMLNKIEQNYSNTIKKLDSKYVDSQYVNLSDKPFGVGITQTYNRSWNSDIKKGDSSTAFQTSSNHYVSINNLALTYDQFRGLEGSWGIENTSTNTTDLTATYYNYGNYNNLINIIRRQDNDSIYYLAYNKNTNFDYPELIYIPSTNNASQCEVELGYDQNNYSQYLSRGTLYIRKKEISSNQYEGFYSLDFVSYTNNYTINIDPLYLVEREEEEEEKPISKYNLIADGQDISISNYYSIQNLSSNLKFSTSSEGINSSYLVINEEAIAKFVFYNKNNYDQSSTLNYYFLDSNGSIIIPNSNEYQIYISAIDGDNLFESNYTTKDPYDQESITLSIAPGQHHVWIKFKHVTDNENSYCIGNCYWNWSYVPTLERYIKENINNSGLDASVITSGTINSSRLSLTSSDIPNLDAAKITSGIIDKNILPSLETNYNYILDETNIENNSTLTLTNNTSRQMYYPLQSNESFNLNLSILEINGFYDYKGIYYQSFSKNISNDDLVSIVPGIYFLNNNYFSDFPLLIQTYTPNSYNITYQYNNKEYSILGEGSNYTVYIAESFLMNGFKLYSKTTSSKKISWNDLAKRPFGPTYAPVFTEQKSGSGSTTSISTVLNNETWTYYRVDNYYNKNKLLNLSCNNFWNRSFSIVSEMVTENSLQNNQYYYTIYDFINDQADLPLIISTPSTISINGINIAEGFWILDNSNSDHTAAYFTPYRQIIRTIDPIYLPDSVKLPPATSSNEGAVLRVVDGAWAAVQLPSASGQSF